MMPPPCRVDAANQGVGVRTAHERGVQHVRAASISSTKRPAPRISALVLQAGDVAAQHAVVGKARHVPRIRAAAASVAATIVS